MTIYFYKVDEAYGCFSFSPTKFTYRVRSGQRLRLLPGAKFVGTADAVLIPVIYAAQTPADAAA